MYCSHHFALMLITSVTAARVQTRRYDGARVVEGYEVPHHQYPFLVSIEYHDTYMDEWSTTCGGNIINTFTVLTACHCATSDEKIHGIIKYIADPKQRRIVAGTGYWKRQSPQKQIARVEKIVTHPKCMNFYSLDKTFLNDVSLYFLKDPLVYGPEVQPLRLPSASIPRALLYLKTLTLNNAWCTTIGWGRTIENVSDQSEKLIGAKVQLLKADECRRRFCSMVSDHCKTDFDGAGQICVASPVASDCFGDSGGPLVCNGYVVGTVSYGDRCLPNLPTVFQGLRPIIEILKIYNVLPEKYDSGWSARIEPGKEIFDPLLDEQPQLGSILNELHTIRELLEILTIEKRKVQKMN